MAAESSPHGPPGARSPAPGGPGGSASQALSIDDDSQEAAAKGKKRKRQLGQQNRDGNWVEEEKRQLRHSGANFDS